MKRFAWLVALPLTPLFIVFAVANRDIVKLSLDPAPIEIEAPLYSVVLASVFIGILVGGLIAWLQAIRWRRRLRIKYQKLSRRENKLRHPEKATDAYKNNTLEIMRIT